ncbi:hypothetical protein ACIBM4_30485 [Streptomyces sp. NPDC050256]|uniref:hypothetical protein n=1 Tax=Streptomyces sp. NPDC050256 TaxID=3365607 RepID=UPI00379407F9
MTAAGGTVRFGSCDAERQWRPQGLAQLPTLRDPHAERLLSGMDELLAALCGPADVLLTHHRPPAAFTEMMHAAGFGARHLPVPGPTGEPVEERLAAHGMDTAGLAGLACAPYAVLPSTRAALTRLGLEGQQPDAGTVRRVNSKTFSTRLGFPGSGVVVTSADELRSAAAGAPCVVKDPYGVSGQGNFVIERAAQLDRLLRVLARREDRIEFVVQPLYERAADFVTHLDIGPAGQVTWHGTRELVNEGHSFRGSGPAGAALLEQLDRTGYRGTVEAVAAAVAAEGYHGPLAVDSMTTTSGELVPVLEVNARFSPALIAARLGVGLRMAFVPVADDDYFERLVHTLSDAGLLAVDGGPGILPLAASTLAPPKGWFFYGIFGDREDGTEPDLTPVLNGLAPRTGRVGTAAHHLEGT